MDHRCKTHPNIPDKHTKRAANQQSQQIANNGGGGNQPVYSLETPGRIPFVVSALEGARLIFNCTGRKV
jgi:hypothetical protein